MVFPKTGLWSDHGRVVQPDEVQCMKQRPGDYWLRMILFALAMVGVGMLIVVLV